MLGGRSRDIDIESAQPATARSGIRRSAFVLAARGLTARGYGLIATGVAVVVGGLAGDVVDLLRVGALLLALPASAVVTVARNRYRVACVRSLEPPRVEAGSPARVTLRLRNVSRLPTAVLLAEDQIPSILGGRPRFTLDRVEAGGERAAAYTVASPVRGRFSVGPLTVRVSDPFGLCELTRAFASTDTLAVTPRVVELSPLRLSGEWTGGGEARSAAVSSVGEDDIATRPYRDGDDLRRVHWRATARVGELMVRREEQPWRNRAAVFLDSRTMAHRGEGTDSSFELAVSLAASVGVHLARRGWAVRLLRDNGEETLAPAGAVGEAVQLNRLADVTGSRGSSLAIMIDTATWPSGSSGSPRSAKAEAASRSAVTAAVERLGVAGWRVLRVGRGDDFAALWPTLGLADARPLPAHAAIAGATP